MNDYELLYLIREGNEDALAIMVEKYQPLLFSKLKRFNIVSVQRDDFYQEGCMVLLEAIRKYDESYNKSFTRFYELLLVRKFINLLNKENKPVSYHEESVFGRFILEEEDVIFCTKTDRLLAKDVLNDLEYLIFDQHYVNNIGLQEISKDLELPIKRVYNTVYRIKQKLRERFDVA